MRLRRIDILDELVGEMQHFLVPVNRNSLIKNRFLEI